MPYYDQREWIERLKKEGHLAEVTEEVDWDRELYGILRRVWDRYGEAGPALLFTNVKDYNKPESRCTKLFTNSVGTYSRIALMMDMPPTGNYPQDLVKEYRKRIKNLIKPVIVEKDKAPCKENIITGDDVNILDFPALRCTARDGGRYIGTMLLVIMKELDSDWMNVGQYRVMVHDEKSGGIFIIPGAQHSGYIFMKYIEKDEPMPIAIAFGVDPVLTLVSGAKIATGVCEYDAAGGIRGAPVELVKCETNDLLVPATAEIVLEGVVDPRERRREGPFGETTGYFGTVPVPKPVVHFTAITHRNDPVYQATGEGYPVNEDHEMISVCYSALCWDILEESAIPGVLDVALPAWATGYSTTIVSVKPSIEGHAQKIAQALWGSRAGFVTNKNIFVVDEDIDPWNAEQVLYAMGWRFRSGEDLYVATRTHGTPLDPRMPPEEKMYMDRVCIDATRPFNWEPRDLWGTEGVGKGIPLKYPPMARISPEDQEKINERWDSFGIKPTPTYVGSPRGPFASWWEPEFLEKFKKGLIHP